MTILTDFLNCSNLFKTFLFGLSLVPAGVISAQSVTMNTHSLTSPVPESYTTAGRIDREITPFFTKQDTTTDSDNQTESEYPDPKSVMFKSLMIPGWGQVVNKQAWKIPIIYGLLAGIAAYNVYLTKRYHDYRAAYYNDTHDDMLFGPTPSYISQSTSPQALQNTRNLLRNRRDFTYVAIVLAYGLNALDAYVYANMRPFDVSEDLSLNANLKPTLLVESTPGVTLQIKLIRHLKTK